MQHKQRQLLAAISRAQANFNGGLGPTPIFEGILADLLVLTAAPFGCVGEVQLDDQGRPFVMLNSPSDMVWDESGPCGPGHRPAATQSSLHLTEPALITALLSGVPVILNAPDSGLGVLSSFLGIPIHCGGSLVAVVALANSPERFEPAHADFLAPLCQTIGHLVQARRNDSDRAAAVLGLNKISQQLAQKTHALQERLQFIEKITSRAPGVVVQFRLRPDGHMSFPYASDALRDIYGAEPQTVVHDAASMVRLHHREDLKGIITSALESAQHLTPWRHEYRVKAADGSTRWLFADALPEREGDGSVLWCGFVTDITARKNAEQRIERLAFFDDLTGLPNRRLLIDRLQAAMVASGRHRQAGALLYIDLDNFKDLNDTQGHDAGDQLLQQVAARLGQCVRAVDTVARLGGDEFVVMLESLRATPAEAATQAELVGRKILTVLNEPYQLRGLAHHSTPSIGVAIFHDHLHGVEELLKRADLAMYQAKAAGRNGLCFYEPAMQSVVTLRAELESELRLGVQRGEIQAYYQPVVDSAGRMTGVEALARWAHPSRGILAPGEFIPIAERTGLILPLGQWMLEAVCKQLAAWSAQPATSGLSISVNVSARQFRHAEFVAQVKGLLAATQANPLRLKIELTESMLLADVEDVIGKMGELKNIGVSFSLDDFGTGYSSLSYLKRLPLHQLKIDQSFVRDLLIDPNDAAIARTIVALAHSLGLEVVAEGVESEGQRDFLVRSGCHGMQGYLFGRPVPVAQLRLP